MRSVLLLLAACQSPSKPDGERADDTNTPAPTLCAGDACVGPDGLGLVLTHSGAPRLELPADGIQLGVWPTLDTSLSHDPTYPNAATRWLPMTGVAVAEHDDQHMVLDLSFEGAAATLTLTAGGAGRIAARLVVDRVDEGQALSFRLRPTVGINEGFYGLGELFDRPEHRGTVRAMHLIADFEMESSYNEAHVPVPFLIGTEGWGLFVEEDHPTVFDVAATTSERVEVTTGKGAEATEGFAFHLFTANAALDVTAHYLAVTGSPAVPAAWALGPLLWRDENIDQNEVLDDIETLRALDLPASGIWIDRPYATGVNTFDFEPSLYPDPADMVRQANDLGLRVGVWHTPYVSDEDAPDLNAEAESQGYFAPTTPIIFNHWGKPIDFTNPDAMDWWQDLIGRYTALGIEGYKLDYGEDVVIGYGGGSTGWVFSDGTDERVMHKGYPRLYHQAYGETLGPDGGFLLCRAGTWGDQTTTSIIWPGDLDADLSQHRDVRDDGSLAVGGLPAAVSAAVGLGPSGYPFFGSDTGGYRHSPPSVETFVRWFQHTALSAVMQVGNSSSTQPWEILADEPELLDLYRDYSRLHLRLFPALWTQAQDLATGGRPLLRPFGLQEPGWGQHPADVYFLGEDLLVAPVVTAGATTRTFPRPAGDWLAFADGEALGGTPGDMVTVDAPLDVLPLFIRAGAVVPLLRPDIDTLAPVAEGTGLESYANDAGRLWSRAACGGSSTAALWDGSSIALTDDGNAVDISFVEGSVFNQGAAVELVGLSTAPASVTADGSTTDDWDFTDGVLTVPAFAGSLRVAR